MREAVEERAGEPLRADAFMMPPFLSVSCAAREREAYQFVPLRGRFARAGPLLVDGPPGGREQDNRKSSAASRRGPRRRPGWTSKMGQRDIRRLLISGAMVIVRWACRKGTPEGSWLHRMLARKPRMLVAIAIANKMARSIWAMLTKGEDYRVPVAVAA